MELSKQTRKTLKWNFHKFGVFEAILWDDKLTDFRACISGSNPTIWTSDPEFLKALKIAIEDTLKEIE